MHHSLSFPPFSHFPLICFFTFTSKWINSFQNSLFQKKLTKTLPRNNVRHQKKTHIFPTSSHKGTSCQSMPISYMWMPSCILDKRIFKAFLLSLGMNTVLAGSTIKPFVFISISSLQTITVCSHSYIFIWHLSLWLEELLWAEFGSLYSVHQKD